METLPEGGGGITVAVAPGVPPPISPVPLGAPGLALILALAMLLGLRRLRAAA